jgi:hypothetical protein
MHTVAINTLTVFDVVHAHPLLAPVVRASDWLHQGVIGFGYEANEYELPARMPRQRRCGGLSRTEYRELQGSWRIETNVCPKIASFH